MCDCDELLVAAGERAGALLPRAVNPTRSSAAATLAVAQDVGQHPAVFAPRALPGVNPSTFVVGHPASPKSLSGHANYEHPAVVVTREAPGGVRFWPEGWVRHFRFHCVSTLPLNFVLPPKLPKGTRVVIFPGGLLPSHAIAGHWTGGYRPSTPLQHIRGLFAADRPDPPLRYLRHYLRPTPWVAEAWRE